MKIYFTISVLLFGMGNAQIYTPNGNINGTTTNSEVGNVGIGTTTPTSKLTVAGDIAYGEALSNTLTRDDAGAMGVGIKSGFYQTENPINYPAGATSWWHLLDVRHSNTNNNYAMQFSGYFGDQELWFRKTGNNASQPWRRVVMEQTNGNVGIGTYTPSSWGHGGSVKVLELYNSNTSIHSQNQVILIQDLLALEKVQ